MISKQTPTRMARLVAQWRRSGESQARFARRHQLRTWTFWYWCRKLSGPVKVDGDPRPTPTFVPVDVVAQPSAPVMEVVLSGGERLQIAAGAPTALVQAVVTALRARC